MTITIEGKVAVMKKKSSFDFVSENRYFSGADSYTMTITFPLKDCPQNIAIFGHIHRKDVDKDNILLPCEIRDGSFVKVGSIAITELSDIEVKTQFLEGRSADNYSSSFDTRYINEFELGYPDTTPANNPCAYQPGYDSGKMWFALPWVNNNTGNIQNKLVADEQNSHWDSSVQGLSFQPYLIYITKLIMNAMGYTYDFSHWEQSPYRLLIICNAVPYAWDIRNWAAALPHWTVTEFLEQLEYLMNCEFEVDHTQKHVTFQTSHEAIESAGEVSLEKVLDDYTVSTEDAGDCKYRERLNYKFADCDHEMWKYYVCPEALAAGIEHLKTGGWYWEKWKTMEDLFSRVPNWINCSSGDSPSGPKACIIYIEETHCYFVMRRVANVITGHSDEGYPYGYVYRFCQPVNRFAPHISDADADTIELKIVPAWIDDTDNAHGQVIFLPLGDYGTDVATQSLSWDEKFAQQRTSGDYFITQYATKESEEYLDKLYVGFCHSVNVYWLYPRPTIDTVEVYSDGTWQKRDYSLSFDYAYFQDSHFSRKIDPEHKYTFKFLSDNVPNVRALYHIGGKDYICSKLTTTFNEFGRSQLIKGEFYRVL